MVTKEILREAVHAAAAIHDKALWQWLAQNLHDWNAPNGAAQAMSWRPANPSTAESDTCNPCI